MRSRLREVDGEEEAEVVDEEDMEYAEPVFSCCFCGEVLTDEDEDWMGVLLYDKDTGKAGQMWFCHEKHFREKLHPDYNIEA